MTSAVRFLHRSLLTHPGLLSLAAYASLQACATPGDPTRLIASNHGTHSLPALEGAANGRGRIETVWVQINDVYEITPLENGTSGGLERVAGLEARLAKINPNTRTVIAGDFLNPSASNSATHEGKPLNGRHMVDTLNGFLDLAAFGNHEFDLSEDDFRARMQESRFDWVASNVLDARSSLPFEGAPPCRLYEFTDADGDRVRIGVFSATVDSNPASYVRYTPWLESARKAVRFLRDREKANVVIALTHLPLHSDRELLASVPGIDLLMGGHEHERMRVPVTSPEGRTIEIFKADANARTSWVHAIRWDAAAQRASIESTPLVIGDRSPSDSRVARTVQTWMERVQEGFRRKGFEPERVIFEVTSPLDGRSTVVRRESTVLTDLLLQSLLAAFPEADVALFNGGLIRIDDIIPPGPFTEYDLLRVAPYADRTVVARVRGEVLEGILNAGTAARGGGSFLHASGASTRPLDAGRAYTVVLNEYLYRQIESGFGNSSKFQSREWRPFEDVRFRDDFRKTLAVNLGKTGKSAP